MCEIPGSEIFLNGYGMELRILEEVGHAFHTSYRAAGYS